MSKVGYEVVPEMESKLIEGLNPFIEAAYNKHMTSGPRKARNEGVEVDITAGTLDPLHELYVATGLPPQEIFTPELIGRVRDSHETHIAELEGQGVDAKPAIRLAGQMNLGTENNLPWYHGEQYATFKGHDSLETLLSRWTLEEADHGPLIELWGMTSGAISPKEAHYIKAALLMGGIGVATESVAAINAFTEPQEYDTYDAHQDLGKILDPIGKKIMNKIAGHEFRHGNMFGDIGEGIYNLDQDLREYALIIEAATQRRFAMPAAESYPNFRESAVQIAVHGLFTIEGIVKRQRERVERLGLLELDVSTRAAEDAQKTLTQVIDLSSRLNSMRIREVEKATEKYIASEKAEGRVPLILGRTVISEGSSLKVLPDAA